VDQHAGVLEGEALALGAGGQDDGRGGRGLPHADGLDLRLDELHRVVDRRQRGERATGAVDVHVDVAVRVLGLEVQQLGHDDVRDAVVDRGAQEDDPLLEEPAVDVERALAARGLLDDDRDRVVGRVAEAHGSSLSA
jgi:hypothetical protein